MWIVMFFGLLVGGWLVFWVVTEALKEKCEVDKKHVGVFDFSEITLEVLEELRAERNRRQGL